MRKAFISVSIALSLLTILAGTAFTMFWVPDASGLFNIISTTISSEKILPTGSLTIMDLTSTATYTGTLDGTSTIQGTLLVYQNGNVNFHGVETFTGKINGVPGTVTFKLTGENDTPEAVHLTAVIVSATGDLVNVRGVLSKDLFAHTYTGRLRGEEE